MSNRSRTLRDYGIKLQEFPIIATVLMGKFIVDCANELERLDADLSTVRTLLDESSGLLEVARKATQNRILREDCRVPIEEPVK